MPEILLHPVATFRDDFTDMSTVERAVFFALLPVVASLGAILGIIGIVALLTFLPV